MRKKVINIYTVDSGVPVPEPIHMPLARLEIGESFVFDIAKRNSVQTVASRIKKEKGMEFTIHKIDEQTARIWRIA